MSTPEAPHPLGRLRVLRAAPVAPLSASRNSRRLVSIPDFRSRDRKDKEAQIVIEQWPSITTRGDLTYRLDTDHQRPRSSCRGSRPDCSIAAVNILTLQRGSFCGGRSGLQAMMIANVVMDHLALSSGYSAGIQFMTQYMQAGLKQAIRCTPHSSSTRCHCPGLKSSLWVFPARSTGSPDLPNEANKKFVVGFQEKYKRMPSFYAAQAYDAAGLIGSAVTAVKGDLSKKDEMRAEMPKGKLCVSPRTEQIRNNHLPYPKLLSTRSC